MDSRVEISVNVDIIIVVRAIGSGVCGQTGEFPNSGCEGIVMWKPCHALRMC